MRPSGSGRWEVGIEAVIAFVSSLKDLSQRASVQVHSYVPVSQAALNDLP
jgi:hypothetical protein